MIVNCLVKFHRFGGVLLIVCLLVYRKLSRLKSTLKDKAQIKEKGKKIQKVLTKTRSEKAKEGRWKSQMRKNKQK